MILIKIVIANGILYVWHSDKYAALFQKKELRTHALFIKLFDLKSH